VLYVSSTFDFDLESFGGRPDGVLEFFPFAPAEDPLIPIESELLWEFILD
jgi:hypothetical protein